MSEKKTLSISIEATPWQIAKVIVGLALAILGLDQVRAVWAGTPAQVKEAVVNSNDSLRTELKAFGTLALSNKQEIEELRTELAERIEASRLSQESLTVKVGQNLEGFLRPLLQNHTEGNK